MPPMVVATCGNRPKGLTRLWSAILKIIGVGVIVCKPISSMVSTFIKLTLDPLSIWTPSIKDPSMRTSTVGAPGSNDMS